MNLVRGMYRIFEKLGDILTSKETTFYLSKLSKQTNKQTFL
jgi:hypothetical protein